MKVYNNKQEAVDAVDRALDEIDNLVVSMGLQITYGDRAWTDVSAVYLDEDGNKCRYSDSI